MYISLFLSVYLFAVDLGEFIGVGFSVLGVLGGLVEGLLVDDFHGAVVGDSVFVFS